MATTASFKQQCPSCEAMVPIRDPNLVGRKIDCPKCKYRFVVEDPGDAADAEEGEKKPKKGKKGEELNGKSLKSKAGARTRDEDDDGKEGGAKGGNSKLMLIIGVSAVAIIALGAVFYFVFMDSPGTNKAASSGTGTGTNTPVNNTPPTTEPKKETAEKADNTPAASSATGEFITNMLPPTTEGVCAVHMQSLMKTVVGREIFDMPGAFDVTALQRKLGFAVKDIDLLVMAWSFRNNWSLNILHTTSPIDTDAVQKLLRAKPVAEKDQIEGQEYFILEQNSWIDQLGRSTYGFLTQTHSGLVPRRNGPLALRIYDVQTLVFADLAPMQEFLKVRGKFPAVPEEKKEEKKEDEAPSSGRGGGKSMPAVSFGQGAGGPGGQGQGETSAETPEPTSSANFMTVKRELKFVLDHLEVKKPVLSIVIDTTAAGRSPAAPFGLNPLKLSVLFQDATYAGAALLMKDGITLTLASLFQNDDDARRRQRKMEGSEGKDLAERLTAYLGTKVTPPDGDSDPQNASGGGRGGMAGGGKFGMPGGGMGMQGGGMGMPGMGGGGRQSGGVGMGSPSGGMGNGGRQSGGGNMSPPGGGMGMPGGGMGMPGMGGMGMPGMGGQGGQDVAKEQEPSKASVKVATQEKTLVLLTITLSDETPRGKVVKGLIHQEVMKQKGYLDMTAGTSRIHELAEALRMYPERNQAMFPRGTLERTIPSSRRGRPYPPNERLSWMVGLLPFFGPEQVSLYERIDRTKSWRDPDNLPVASTIVPQFLDPQNPPGTWWVRSGSNDQLAATHYVGIAGVGVDAAEYSDADPEMTKKLGIFGYDRAMKLRDITDKASMTILVAEVPTFYKRPWMAGGGSTVMGVPETNSIQPFISTQRDGKRGTNVVMADGSVRFLSENISDEVFKALATAKGGEAVLLQGKDSAVIPMPEGQAEMKDIPPIAVPAQAAPKVDVAPPKEEKPQTRSDGSNEKVLAVLLNNCANCHKGPTSKGRTQIFKSDGTLNPDASRQKILQAVGPRGKMPKGKPRLGSDDIDAIKNWAESN